MYSSILIFRKREGEGRGNGHDLGCVQDVRKMFARGVQDVCKMCTRCVQDVCKMCARCVQGVRKMWARCAQYVWKMYAYVMFDIIEPHEFRKYSTCWVIEKSEEPCRILKKFVHACVFQCNSCKSIAWVCSVY